jgi:hypothetical protein
MINKKYPTHENILTMDLFRFIQGLGKDFGLGTNKNQLT